ncbi:MAG: methyltransferase domain-containing protein [Geobacter sp.]|nr:methyltransferase domain-containing protein [Geobacter sp.]
MIAGSIRTYFGFFERKGVRTILDYGAGTLRNARFLSEKGFSVYAADVPEQVRRIMRMSASNGLAGILETGALQRGALGVDMVLSTYVLNIIPDGAEKWSYLKNISINLRDEGYLLIETRCRREDAACGTGCSFHAKCPSCVKTYSHDELDRLVTPFGFRRLSHYYRRHAVAVLYQKVDD